MTKIGGFLITEMTQGNKFSGWNNNFKKLKKMEDLPY